MDSHVGKGDRGDGFPCNGFRTEPLDAVEEGREHLGVETDPHRRRVYTPHHPVEVLLPLGKAHHCDRSDPHGDRRLPDDAQADARHQATCRAESGADH